MIVKQGREPMSRAGSMDMSSSDNGGDFWSGASKPERTNADYRLDPNAKRPMARWKKAVLYSTLAFFLGSAVLLILLPTIASAFVPGLVASQAPKYINGDASLQEASISWFGPQRLQRLKIRSVGNDLLECDVEVEGGLFDVITGGANLGQVTVSRAKLNVIRGSDGAINFSQLSKAPKQTPEVKPANATPVTLPSDLNVRLDVRNLDFSYTDLGLGESSKVTLNNVDLRAVAAIGEPLTFALKTKSGAGSINADLNISNWEDLGELRPEKAKIDGSIDISNLPTSILDAFVPSGENRPNLRLGLGEAVSLRSVVKGSRDNGQLSIDVKSAGLNALISVALKDEFITSTAPISLEVAGSSLHSLVPGIRQGLESAPDISVDSLPNVNLRIADIKIPFSKGEIKTLRGASASLELGLSEFSGGLDIDGTQKQFRLTPTKLTVQTADLAKSLEGSLTTDLVVDGAAGGLVRVGFSSGSLLNSTGMLSSTIPKELRATVSIRNIATALLQPFVNSTGIDLQQDVGPSIDLSLDAAAGTPISDSLPPTSISLNIATREIKASTKFTADDRGIEFETDSTEIEMKSAGRLLSRFIKPETGWIVNPRSGVAVITVSGAALPESPSGSFEFDKLQLRSTVKLDNFAVSRIGDASSAISIRNATVGLGAASGRLSTDIKSSLSINTKPTEFSATIDIPDLFVKPTSESASFIAQPKSLRPGGKISLKGVPVSTAGLFMEKNEPETGQLITFIEGVIGEAVDITIASQPDQNTNRFGIGLNVRAPKLTCDLSGNVSEREVGLASAKVGLTIDGATVSSVLGRFAPDIAGLPSLSSPSKIGLSVGSFVLPLDAASKPVWSHAGMLSLALQSDGRTLIDGLRVREADGSERSLGRIGFQGLKMNASLPFQTIFGAGQPDARMLNADLSASIIGPSQTSLCDVKFKTSVEIDTGRPVGPLGLDVLLDRIDVRQFESIAGQSNQISSFIGGLLTIRSNLTVTPDAKRDPFDFDTSTLELTTALESKGFGTSDPVVVRVSPRFVEIPKPTTLTIRIDPAAANTLLRGDSKNDPPLVLTRASAVSVTIDSLSIPRVAGGELKIQTQVSAPEVRFVDNTGREMILAESKFSLATDNTVPTKPINFSLEMKSIAFGSLTTTKPIALRGSLENLIGADGSFLISNGILSFNADVKGIPTVLIDTLSDQKGLLVDLLGDAADVVASVNKVPLKHAADLNGQQFTFKMSSARVSTSVNGSVSDSVFSSSVPLSVSVVEITNALTQRYIGAVPVLKKLEKQNVQQAATISEQGLRVPLDSDMKKLNGTIIFDPGEVTYEVNPMLTKLLKDKALRSGGVMGNKLQPARVVFTNGIGVLERYALPLGEFSVGLEGKVDMVSQRSEMVIWIPAAQLADAVTSQVTALLSAGSAATSDSNTILSTLLEIVPNWPFKASGPLTSPASSLTLDTERVFEDFKKNGGYKKLIERVGGSKLKDLLKPKLPNTPIVPK